MRRMLSICRRELRAVWGTATGWWVAGAWWAVAGLLLTALVDGYVRRGQEQISGLMGGAGLSLTDDLLLPWFANLSVVLLVVVPALTMRTFAEERQLGTLELLRTTPATATTLAVGKWLAATLSGWTLLATAALMPLCLLPWQAPDAGVLVASVLGLGLQVATTAALGVWMSARASNTLLAFISAFAAAVGLWVMGWIDPDPTAAISQLSLSVHTRDLLRGVVRLSDVAWHGAVTAGLLWMTRLRLDDEVWQ